MPFINDDFLLTTKFARKLYHKYAAEEPVFDYHCHLPPKDIAENRQFKNLFEIWLEGDHYKWRAMRSNGVSEKFCTGPASPDGKIQCLGGHGSANHPQPAVSLDASGTETLFRHFRAAQRKDRGQGLEKGQCQPRHAGDDHAGHPEENERQGGLHHG